MARRRLKHEGVLRVGGQRLADHHSALGPEVGVLDAHRPGDDFAITGQRLIHVLERVGQTALRQAKSIGATKIAFAPLIRDQGNTSIGVGAVETAVVKGMLLAYDTELRLQREGLSNEYKLTDWSVEAGPAYFDETVAGVRDAVSQAAADTAKRSSDNYAIGTK